MREGNALRYVFIVMAIALMVGGGWMAAGEWPKLGMTLLFLGLGIGGQNAKTWWDNRRPSLKLEGIREEEAELLAESYQKAITDYRYLEQARTQLKDRELVNQLGRMQHISRNMLSYLEKNPKKISAAQPFIDYYQDRAVGLVRKYQELEATELSTERVAELKIRMKTTLSGFDEAYAEQFERMLNDQMMTTDAELTVMEQHLDAHGISLERPSDEVVMTRAEAKQREPSMEGMRVSLEKETGVKIRGMNSGEVQGRKGPQHSTCQIYGRRKGMNSGEVQGRKGPQPLYMGGGSRYSLIPAGEKPDVVKHKVLQSLLAIFLGTFGAHKFYQGKTFWGFLYAALFWTTIPTFVSIVEGIRYLVMPMDDFYVQYCREDDK